MTVADAAAFWALRLEALRESPEAFGSAYEESVVRPLGEAEERLRSLSPHEGSFVLAAVAESGALLGMLGVRREEGMKVRHRAYVWGVYVRPEARGQGVARALLERALAQARAVPGLEQLHLAVVSENAAAMALYTSLGFTRYGVEPRALSVNGRYLDEVMMVLRLR